MAWERTYHFDYIKRLTDEDLAAHIAFVRSDDKTEREQVCFQKKKNLCDTPYCPRGQVLNSFMAHGRKERKERTKGIGMTPRENALVGTNKPASAGAEKKKIE